MTLRRLALAAAIALVGTDPGAMPVVEAIDDTTVRLRFADGRTLSGHNLAGQSFQLDGMALRIGAVTRADGVWMHDLQVRDAATDTWVPVCAADRDGRRWAAFLAGSTTPTGEFVPDARRLSVTCSAGVEAKCLRAGYRPEAGGGRALARFQACTRMFRADYCGDGQPATVDGMLIDVHDDEGIQTPANTPGLRFEAGWSPSGAVCVHHARVPARENLAAVLKRCPRLAPVSGEACTEDAARRTGAVLFNRSAHRPEQP